MIRYCLTVFLGATLLFLVQPMLGRLMLPSFGGLAIVWTTSVLVFQVLLLAGYLWAHLLHRFFSPRAGLMIHALAVIAAAFTIPPQVASQPMIELAGSIPLRVGWLLLQTIGPAFLVLSATSPLIQAWQASTHSGRNPFRLYALSNAGSLAGLIAYPLVIESTMGLQSQARWWSVAFVAYAASLVWSGMQVWSLKSWHPETDGKTDLAGASAKTRVAWVLLPATASALMLSVTTVLCQEIASFPFLWVLPLAAYLVSWIVAFDRPDWYRSRPVYFLLVLSGMAGLVLQFLGTDVTIVVHMLVMTAICFSGCWLCHGELERCKPHPGQLTLFWTMTSLGGLVGGSLVVVGAPRLLGNFYEFHLSLAAAVTVGYLVVVAGAGQPERPRFGWQSGFWSLLGMTLLAMLGAGFFQTEAVAEKRGRRFHIRSDYGLMSVWESAEYRYIQSGQTMHGRQYRDEARRYQALDYYAPDRAAGIAITAHREWKRISGSPVAGMPVGLEIGVIGLGSGCMTAWAEVGDRIRFYELNPQVLEIAWQWFDWLPHARHLGTLVEPVVVGDARVQMTRELASGRRGVLDVLVVDAFTSDSIPAHLLTRECMELYRQHLRPDGILVVHITNRSLDLRPVLRGAAGPGQESLLFEHPSSDLDPYGCTWVVIGNREQLRQSGLEARATPWPDGIQSITWSDEFNCVMWLVDWGVDINIDSLTRRRKMADRTGSKSE